MKCGVSGTHKRNIEACPSLNYFTLDTRQRVHQGAVAEVKPAMELPFGVFGPPLPIECKNIGR
jgi:hypothetical protein